MMMVTIVGWCVETEGREDSSKLVSMAFDVKGFSSCVSHVVLTKIKTPDYYGDLGVRSNASMEEVILDVCWPSCSHHRCTDQRSIQGARTRVSSRPVVLHGLVAVKSDGHTDQQE